MTLDKKSENQGEKCQDFFFFFFSKILGSVNLQDATSIKEVVATREDDVWGNLGFLSKDAPPLKVLLRGLERKKQSIKCSRKPKN